MVTPAKRVNIVSLELVKESSLLYSPRQCLSVFDAYELVAPFIKNKDREHLLVVGLNTKNEPIVINIAHIGTVNQSIATPRDILKPVLLSNGNRMIVAHNHPSGNVKPSEQDKQLTKRLQEAGKIIGDDATKLFHTAGELIPYNDLYRLIYGKDWLSGDEASRAEALAWLALAALPVGKIAQLSKEIKAGNKLLKGVSLTDKELKILAKSGYLESEAFRLAKMDQYEITWNRNVGVTQEFIKGTSIPKSFTFKGIKIDGKEVWVHGNATKHMGEILSSGSGKQTLILENELMISFRESVKNILPNVKPGRNFFIIDGWEIGIDGSTGVIYHALYKP